MSFLGSIVDSIGGEKAPPPPQRPLNRPNSANTGRAINSNGKGGPRPGAHPAPALTGMKRKAGDDIHPTSSKISRPNTPSDSAVKRVAAPPLNAPKPHMTKLSGDPKAQADKVRNPQASTPSAASLDNAAKTVPKGSYAEMMARAKQSAELRAQSQVGTIRHQETKKDKMSRLAERRKMEQDKGRSKSSKTESSGLKDVRKEISRSASPAKKTTPDSVKAAKAPQTSSYKGTMGMAASQSRPRTNGRTGAKQSRYDEYLGTDEEDNSDVLDEEDGYGSDASSDMEAGFDDVDMEEAQALRAAKEDDARELAVESQLKREKEERRKKLLGLAKKQR